MPDAPATRDGRDTPLAAEPSPALAALAAAFQHVIIGMVVTGPDCQVLGYDRDELLALDSASAHPDDQAIVMT